MKNTTAKVINGLGSNIHVYPTIGNHDTFPQDVIGMSIPHQNKAINEWSVTWDAMLNNSEQAKLFHDWGYYSLPLVNSSGD